MDAKSRIRMSIYNIYSSIVPIKINIHVYDIITFLILYYCCALLLYRRYRIILPHTQIHNKTVNHEMPRTETTAKDYNNIIKSPMGNFYGDGERVRIVE